MSAKPLKISEIVRYLEAKGVKWSCPSSCGHKKFNFIDEQKAADRLAILGFPFPNHDLSKTNMYDVVLLACVNCGGVRLHMRTAIVQWAELNPPH